MVKKNTILKLIFLVFFVSISFVSADLINDELHVNLQVTDAEGDVMTGTFLFKFDIATDANCLNVIYTNSTTLTTDSRGIISYYLPSTSMNFQDQYYLCYYRNSTLIDVVKIARNPYSFTAKNVNVSGILVDSNLNLSNYNLSANYIFGDGSGLTNLNVSEINLSGYYTSSEIDSFKFWNDTYATFNKTYADTLYYGIDNPYNYYNSTTLSGVVNGSGSQGYIPIWNGTTTLNNSIIYQNGSKIGIGTTNPSYLFNVQSSGGVDAVMYFDSGSAANAWLVASAGTDDKIPMVSLWDNTGGAYSVLNSFYIALDRGISPLFANQNDVLFSNNYLNKDIHFITNDAGSKKIRMTIDSTGKLGINTTTPQNTLNVVGDLNVTGTIYGNGSYLTGISSGHNADGNYLYNDSLTMYFNDTKLNETILVISSQFNETDLINSIGNWTADKINYYNKTESDSRFINVGEEVNFTVNNTNYLDGYDSSFFMPLNNSVYGQFDFNGGWTSGGLSIIDGNMYAQAGYFYDINSLAVSNLNVNGSIYPPEGFDNQFDIGNSTRRWNDANFGGVVTAGAFVGDGSGLTNLSGVVSGSGNFGYIPMWNGTTSLNNSVIYQNGSKIGIGTMNPSSPIEIDFSSANLQIVGTAGGTDGYPKLQTSGGSLFLGNTQVTGVFYGDADLTRDLGSSVRRWKSFYSNKITDNGTFVGINTTTPQNTLNVVGDGNFTGNVYGTFVGDGSGLTNLSNVVNGSGNPGYIPMWNGTSSLNNSIIYQNGSKIGIGTTNPQNTLNVVGSTNITGSMIIGTINITTESNGDVNVW